MKTRLSIALLLAVLFGPSVVAEEAWRELHGRISGDRDRMAHSLEEAHERLLARALAEEDAESVERLRRRVPAVRKHGYGLLPEIVANQERGSRPPQRTRYSLDGLSRSHTAEIREAARLAERAVEPEAEPLVALVDEFQHLHERLQNLEDHLDYHAEWQVAVVEYRDYFTARNQLTWKVQRFVDLLEQGEEPEKADRMRSEVVGELASFAPAAGLRIERGPAGRAVLPVEVATDIEDAEFLRAVKEAIEEEYSAAEAPRAARFEVRVRWRRLEPEEPPATGETIDPERHLDGFPPDALVLTTGAAGTYALPRRAVLLGTAPISPRTLAHEFGHLLGFEDAYLRGYEGEPQDPHGVVLVEWVGLSDDLMGNPAGGSVSREMIETLLEAYGD